MLMVVQSIAHLSLRNAASPEEFVAEFDGRLAALAKSHGLLVESDWQGADLGALVRQQLEPYMVDGRDRRRQARPVLASGKVFLNWSNSVRNQRPMLKFVWRELGGPAVQEPDHAGYGTSVIDCGVPEAVGSGNSLRRGSCSPSSFRSRRRAVRTRHPSEQEQPLDLGLVNLILRP